MMKPKWENAARVPGGARWERGCVDVKKPAMLAAAALLVLALVTGALAEGERIAILGGTAAENALLAQAVEKAESLGEVFGYELTVLECPDEAAWVRGYIAAVDAGCELIIGIGRQAAACAAASAQERHEGIAYAVIDADADSEYVASFSYSVEQAAYVVGVMAASALPGETGFGFVGSFDDVESFRYRWGFAEGVRSVTPQARFAFAYTGGADSDAACDLALSLRAQGCGFIFSDAAAASAGVARAALELSWTDTPLYTAGQDADAIGEDNPYVLASQLKNIGVTTAIVIDNFYAGTLAPGLTVLDMASGTVGVSHVTAEGAWRNGEVLTDGVLERCRAAAEAIVSGELVLEVPDAENYEFPGL